MCHTILRAQSRQPDHVSGCPGYVPVLAMFAMKVAADPTKGIAAGAWKKMVKGFFLNGVNSF